MNDFRFNFISLLYLLKFCVKYEILYANPKDENSILVYRNEFKDMPEGWYSVNAHTLASEMLREEDMDGQKALLEEIERRGLKLDFVPEPFVPEEF